MKKLKRAAPFISSGETVSTLACDALIALLPALAWAIYAFGIRALQVAALAVVAFGVPDILSRLVMRKKPLFDLTAVVSALVFALLMPYDAPFYAVCAGAAFAAVAGKAIWGGLGKNLFNPALLGVVFVNIAWRAQLAATALAEGADVLSALRGGELSPVPLVEMFIGDMGGAMGEISTLLILCGWVYLVLRRTVTWHATVAYFVGAACACVLLCPVDDVMRYTLGQLFAGSLAFCAAFAANDTVTTPVKTTGRLLFGIGCGALAIVLRQFVPFCDGAVLAVLAMNPLSRALDRI